MNLITVELQKQNYNSKIDNAESYQNNFKGNSTVLNTILENDEFINNQKTEEKVGFKEGIKLIGTGFVNKLKNMATSIIKHPKEAIIAMGATSLLIAATPIIGISSATSGAFLALGFAAYAIGKTAIDVVETIKDNKAGRYNEVREDLQQLGGDGVDLALSLPFAPKAVNQVSRFARYGRGTVGLNTELLSNLKNCRSYSDVGLEFAKADTVINYEMIGNEMGLTVKPEIKITKNATLNSPNYDNVTGKIEIPEQLLTSEGKMMMRAQGKNIEMELRHELEHFNQASEIVKTYGVEGLKEQMTNVYKYSYQEAGGTLNTSDPNFDLNKRNTLEKFGHLKEQADNMIFGDGSVFNEKLYKDVINQQGMYEQGSPQAIKASEYNAGVMEKATKGKELEELIQKGDKEGFLKMYFENILEKEAKATENAYKAEVTKLRPSIANDMLMAEASAEKYINKDDSSLKQDK